jgi:FixJ family two-component response regulator
MNTRVESLVIVILPDAGRRETIGRKLRQCGIVIRLHDGFVECLDELHASAEVLSFCVICPMCGDAMTGLQFQQELKRLPHAASIVFCESPLVLGDVVEAMRQGAVAVVEPNDDFRRLMSFVEEGLERSRVQRDYERRCCETLERLGRLNLGEGQVLQGIMAGKLNKEIAHHLKVSIRTIEQRRRELFRKMDVQHPSLLVRKVIEAAQIPPPPIRPDERGDWLEEIWRDFAHPLVCRPPVLATVPCGLMDPGDRELQGERTVT